MGLQGESGLTSLTFEHKLDHLGGFALPRFKLPLPDGVEGGVDQHGISSQHSGGLDGAIGLDDRFDSDDAMNVHLLGQVGITRRDPRGNFSVRVGRSGSGLSGHEARRYGHERNRDE